MSRVLGALAALALTAGLVSGCSGNASAPAADPSPSSTSASGSTAKSEKFQPTDEDRSAIRALLRVRAKALKTGDRRAFMATVDTADPDLVHQQRLLFDNLRKLPVASVGYDVDDAAGWVAAKVKGDDPVFRPRVLEQVRLDIDERPVTNPLEDTFVRRDAGWLLGAESLPGKYADSDVQSRPWGGDVPIAVARSGRLVVVVDRADGDQAPELAQDLAGYIGFAADALQIPPVYDVLVDATSVGATTEMSTVGTGEAAAVSRNVINFGVEDGGGIAGARIKVNPEGTRRIVADAEVMRHELTHYLTTRRLAGAPSWIVEGLAEWVSTAPASLDDLVIDAGALKHVLGVPRRLPTTGRWGLDPRADYLIARAAVTRVIDDHGVAKLLELGESYGRIAGDDPDVKTARALRRVLGSSEGELVRDAFSDLADMQTR